MRFLEIVEDLITEASAKQRYLTMFPEEIFKSGENIWDNLVVKNVEWAMKTLKKDDKIVWYLRLFKYSYFGEYREEFQSSKWVKKFEQKYGGKPTQLNLRQIQTELEHYMDLNIKEIVDMVFGWTPWDKLQKSLKEVEEEWESQLDDDDRSLEEYGTRYITFPDGYVWFDLERAGCSVEGQAMGHCGNGSGRAGQNVYSLRRPDPRRKGYWIPHLTFILDTDNGHLGEMKGRGNEKPSDKYHGYIVKFLMSDVVKKVVGGGYLPQNNFQLSDLDAKVAEQLFKDKPSLFDSYSAWKFIGTIEDERVDALIREEYGPYILSEVEFGGQTLSNLVEIMEGSSVEDLADEFDLETLKAYADTLQQGHFEISGDGSWQDSYGIENVLDQLLSHENDHYREMKEKLQKYMTDNYSDEIEEEDWDINDSGDIISLAKETMDDKLDDVLRQAYWSGEEVGAYDELWQAFETMKSNFGLVDGVHLVQDYGDGPWKLVATFHGLMELNQKMREYEEDDFYGGHEDPMDNLREFIQEFKDEFEVSDLEVPYYGFSEFSESAALERLVDVINDEID